MQNSAFPSEISISKISELGYRPLPEYLADILKKGKASFLGRGDLKKICKSIAEGNGSYLKITIEDDYINRIVGSEPGDDDLYRYYRLKTSDDCIIDTGVQAINKFNPNIGDVAYLLQFKVKKDILYLVVASIDEDYLFSNTKGLSAIDTTYTNTSTIPELSEKDRLEKGIEALTNMLFKNKN